MTESRLRTSVVAPQVFRGAPAAPASMGAPVAPASMGAPVAPASTAAPNAQGTSRIQDAKYLTYFKRPLPRFAKCLIQDDSHIR